MSLIDLDISASFPESTGFDWSAVEALAPQLRGLTEDLQADREGGVLPFLGLPEENPDGIVHFAATSRERFDRLVVLGIGGSSLGSRALVQALTRPRSGLAEDGSQAGSVWYQEGVDPVEFADLLATVDWERTQWNIISKSGNTIETLSTAFVVLEELERRFGEIGLRDRVVVTTGKGRGALRLLAESRGLEIIEAPSGVGGRFSVLTAVGLYPTAFAGIDTRALLRGAARARDRSLSTDILDNPAAVLAALQILHYRAGRRTVVFMPYATALSGLAEWFCQLWAESLGKRRGEESVGPTPIAALGVRDQHSQLQLFMEGPKDKNLLFVELAGFSSRVTVPILKAVPAAVQHLCGKSLEGIVAAELNGTRQALFEQGCPSATLRLRTLSAESLGAMLMLLEVTTALAAGLLDVDPYNQPGVELGKRYAHGLLGRSKEAHYAASLMATKAERFERVLSI